MKIISFYIIVFFLFSCNAGLHFDKRVHRNGYFFELLSRKNKIKPQKENLKEQPFDIPLQIQEENIPMENEPGVALEKKYPVKTTTESSFLKKNKEGLKIIKKNAIQNFVKNYEYEIFPTENKNTAAQQEDKGGIIWTLIGILILVWLLSVLTGGWGLGGLIYILLVVALVLAILRLIEVL